MIAPSLRTTLDEIIPPIPFSKPFESLFLAGATAKRCILASLAGRYLWFQKIGFAGPSKETQSARKDLLKAYPPAIYGGELEANEDFAATQVERQSRSTVSSHVPT